MYCVKCGKILENDDRFCSGCGTVNPDFYSGQNGSNEQNAGSINGNANGQDLMPGAAGGQTVSPYMQPQNYQADVPPVYSPENNNALGFANAGTPVPPAADINGQKAKKKGNAIAIVGVFVIIAAIFLITFGAYAFFNRTVDIPSSGRTVSEDYVPKEYTFNAMNNIKEPEVIWETDNIRVTTQNIVHNGSYSKNAELQLLIENKTGKDLSVRTDSVTVNSVDMPNGNLYSTVPAGQSVTDSVYLDIDLLEKFKIDNINEIDLWFQVRDKENYDLLESSDKVAIETRNSGTNAVMEVPDQVLYDQNDTKIAFESIEYASRYYDDVNVNLYIENNSDVTMDYELGDVTVNGNEIRSYKTITLHPHTKTIYEFYITDNKLDDIKIKDIDDIKIFGFSVTGKDSDTHQTVFKSDTVKAEMP